MMTFASEYQPEPKPGQQNVADFVLQDIKERIEAGEKKYGTKLQTFNGRDPLWDLYQELVDAVMYTRQEILEREVNLNWSYLAGLLDGEGCISVSQSKGKWLRCALEVMMTNRAPLDWAANFTQKGKVYERSDNRQSRRKPYKWLVGGRGDIRFILENVLPFLKVKKGEALVFFVIESLSHCKESGKRIYPEIEEKAAKIISGLKVQNQNAYQEALDLVMYLRQAILEKEAKDGGRSSG